MCFASSRREGHCWQVAEVPSTERLREGWGREALPPSTCEQGWACPWRTFPGRDPEEFSLRMHQQDTAGPVMSPAGHSSFVGLNKTK